MIKEKINSIGCNFSPLSILFLANEKALHLVPNDLTGLFPASQASQGKDSQSGEQFARGRKLGSLLPGEIKFLVQAGDSGDKIRFVFLSTLQWDPVAF